ncbi:MAG TPA: glycosyltransferase family 2 protein [Verrucomicrobiae bacterium]
MIFWASRRPAPPVGTPDTKPKISFVLVVADEQERIVQRVANLLNAVYPAEAMEAVVVTDGSKDSTVARLRELMLTDTRIKLVELPERKGKANGLNEAVQTATGELLVFADARQRFAEDTVSRLIQAFGEKETGAVSGRLVVAGEASAVGQGVSSYWSIETRLRAAESVLDSCIGCTGAVYAMRRDLYQPIPPDTLLDDVVIPMQVVMQGYRVRYLPEAVAYDPQDLSPERERIRKRRTLAGNFQMLFRHPDWLLPWKNRTWFQLIAHKYLRLAGPLLLLLILVSSFMLSDHVFYAFCFWVQLSLYTLAVIGLSVPKVATKAVSLPAGFVFLNWTIVLGLLHYLRSPKSGAWEMVKPK